MKSKLTIEDARELARKAYAMARAAKKSDGLGERTADFMWMLFHLAGVSGAENILEEIRAAEKASE